MGLTIIKGAINASSFVSEFTFAKELLESNNSYNLPYSIVKPAALFIKQGSDSAFYPAIYISAKNIEQKVLLERYKKEKIAKIERSQNYDYVMCSTLKIKNLLPLMKTLFLECEIIPEVEILFLPEKGKTVIFYNLLDKSDCRNSAFIADLIIKIPNIYEKMGKIKS
ncbi:MAG: hypothetical protein PHE89_06245 [Alphaproteobacteria bacterium]|nr:hypothetical protein [Alphaproteobacteria bacterium]